MKLASLTELPDTIRPVSDESGAADRAFGVGVPLPVRASPSSPPDYPETELPTYPVLPEKPTEKPRFNLLSENQSTSTDSNLHVTACVLCSAMLPVGSINNMEQIT